MATFTKRRSDQWQVKIRRAGYPAQSRTFNSKEEAQKWARSIEAEMDKGIYIDRNEAEKNTLYAVLERYAREVSPTKKGGEIEKLRIASIMRQKFTQTKMAALSSRTIATWRNARLCEVSGSTVKREMGLVSSVINHARREWEIQCENPFSLVKRPREGRERDRRFEDDEETRLLAALDIENGKPGGEGARNPWIKPLVLFAIETAMRRSELLSLEWANVDKTKRTAKLPDTKNGESRVVPLSSVALGILEKLPVSLDGRVFPTTADAIKKAFPRACARAGIDDFHFHDLRHEATSRLAKKLSNVIELSRVTGHKDLKMLARYYHTRPEELAEKLG
jgi:integrase